ncbi:hypothetical protein BTVI_82757 [Pitangus sulphuratus]|nr:hypothetical protein BTVI_82757 [Pitangus sulphuratus]
MKRGVTGLVLEGKRREEQREDQGACAWQVEGVMEITAKHCTAALELSPGPQDKLRTFMENEHGEQWKLQIVVADILFINNRNKLMAPLKDEAFDTGPLIEFRLWQELIPCEDGINPQE